jgi:exopolysaccharide production protein ExoQ
MPPFLASCLCALFVAFLLVRDVRNNPGLSHALWIPLLWFLIPASRLPSEWLLGGAILSGDLQEGSPLDRNIFLALMVLGALVVTTRSVSWRSFTISNVTVVLFFLFTLASIFWSDFPLVALKRWHKILGHVIMALVVLTDREPNRSFTALLRRCSYLLLPVSVLFIKYYPALGRGFDPWTGAAQDWGVTTNKNSLGNLCFIMGIFFLAMMFVAPKGKRIVTGLDRYIGIVFLGMSGWLLVRAQSSTCLVSTVIGACVILGLRSTTIRRHFSSLLVTGCVIVGLLLAFTDIKDVFIESLGEDTTLTGRTELWQDLRAVEINPLVGVGFESFWLGDRLERFWQKYWWHPNQAHNGYLETYVNLGLIGLLLQCSMMLSGYMKARRQTLIEFSTPHDDIRLGLAEFRLAFLLGLTAFNLTDATFKAVHPSFFLFFLVSLEYGAARTLAAQPAWRTQVTRDERQPTALNPVVTASLVTRPLVRSVGTRRAIIRPPRHGAS